MLLCDILLRRNNFVEFRPVLLLTSGMRSSLRQEPLMPESDLERTLDAALRDRDWLALTLTDVRENEDELRNVLDRALGAAERNRSSLTEIQLHKSRFDASALTSCKVPVTESGAAGIFRLIFRRRRNEPARDGHIGPQSAAPSGMASGLFLSIPLDPDRAACPILDVSGAGALP